MKNLILTTGFVLLALGVFAYTSSEITSVTVYQQGARITREATLNLKAGTNELVLSDITTSINANSIQVKLSGNAILLSATTRVRQKEDAELPIRTKELTDSIQAITNDITWLNSEKSVYLGEKELITQNQQLNTSEEKTSVEEIIRLSNFYRTRILEINKKTHQIDKDVSELNRLKKTLETKLKALRYQERKNVGEVILKVSSNTATKVKAQISYLTHQAGWSPIYDVRAQGSDKPVDLIYKANVFQTTGYAWDDVSLSISTGNPAADNNRPMLYPWYIDFFQPVVYQDKNYYLKKEAAPVANAMQRSMISEEVMEFESFDEDIAFDVVETENTIAAEYAIDIEQTIPSDGKQHLVAIKEVELPSKFAHHAIPKLNKSTFLIAKVADYGQHNLLPGQANLFYEGMYIGQSYINPNTTVDSMMLSLGRDEKVIVKRNRLSDLTSRQSVGSNTKETRVFEITVRNNNTYGIELDLMDQVPLSQNKEIVVEILEDAGAKVDKDYGSLLWKLKLKSGETKTIRFSYSVKYPKDKNISGLE